MPEDIDIIKPERHLVDLYSHSDGDFGSADDYLISNVLDDIMLVEYIDLSEDGDMVMRNGLMVPVNTLTKAWRKAKVILTGPTVKYCVPGDIVIFPNNLGVTVNKLPIVLDDVKYITSKAVFLNEDRIFGRCKKISG